MRVKKNYHGPDGGKFYIRMNTHNPVMTLSAAVTDTLGPHQYVWVDIEGNTVTLEPTDDERAYKVVRIQGIHHRQSSVSYYAASRILPIPAGKRIPAEILDGKIIIKVEEE